MRKRKVIRYKYQNDKRRKRKINYKRLLLSLGFLCIIALMPLVYSSLFAIETIEIKGNRNIQTKEINKYIDYYIGKNLLTVKSYEVKQSIQEKVPVKDVKVRYKLPHTLIVEVKEREIVAALNYLNGFVLIDSQGVVVKLESKLESYSIPVLTGLNVVDAKIAQKPVFDGDLDHFETLLELIVLLKPISSELSEINLVVDENDDATFYLFTLDGYQVILGNFDSQKVKTLDKLLGDIRKKGMGKGLLDISHKTPIFKPFETGTGVEERR